MAERLKAHAWKQCMS